MAVAALGAVVTVIAALVIVSGLGRNAAATPWARLKTADVHALLFATDDPERLWFGHHGGLLETVDGGRTWSEGTLADADAMNVRQLDDKRLQIAGHEVYLESTDGGATWTPVANDLPGLDLHAFAVDPADPDRAWTFAVGHGLFVTTDAGRHWDLLDPGNWAALTTYRREGRTVLAGVGPSGLVRSRDGGRTWEPMAYPGAPMTALTASLDGTAMYAGTSAGLRRSGDEGATWEETGFRGQALAIAVSPSDPGQVAVVDSNTWFYRSPDAGATWAGP